MELKYNIQCQLIVKRVTVSSIITKIKLFTLLGILQRKNEEWSAIIKGEEILNKWSIIMVCFTHYITLQFR